MRTRLFHLPSSRWAGSGRAYGKLDLLSLSHHFQGLWFLWTGGRDGLWDEVILGCLSCRDGSCGTSFVTRAGLRRGLFGSRCAWGRQVSVHVSTRFTCQLLPPVHLLILWAPGSISRRPCPAARMACASCVALTLPHHLAPRRHLGRLPRRLPSQRLERSHLDTPWAQCPTVEIQNLLFIF